MYDSETALNVATREFVKIPRESLAAAVKTTSSAAAEHYPHDDILSGRYVGAGTFLFVCGGFFVYLLVSLGARKHDKKVVGVRVRSPVSHVAADAAVRVQQEDGNGQAVGKANRRTVIARRQAKLEDFYDPAFASATVDTEYKATYQARPLDHDRMLTLAPSLEDCVSLRSSPSPRLFFGRESLFSPNMSTTSSRTGSPQSVVLGMGGTKTLLVLISKQRLDEKQATQQSEALELLKTRNVDFEVVDGMDPTQRNLLLHLQHISGKRDIYPQFFFVHGDDSITYVGDWKTLRTIHHAEGYPKSYRDANPDISTWDEVFGDTSQMFGV